MIGIDVLLDLAGRQVVQLSLAIGVAGSIALLARRRPHVLYLVWIVVFIKAITPPVWSSRVGVFSWLAASDRHAPAAISVIEESTQMAVDAPPVVSPVRADNSPAPSLDAKPGISEAPRFDWKYLLLVVWVSGTTAMIAIPLSRSVRLRRRMLRNAAAPSDELAGQIEGLRGQVGLSRTVRVVVCNDRIGPAVVGIFRPIVVLPITLLKQPPAAVRGAVAHELVHLRRHDPLLALLQWAAAALWWFFPPMWWVSRRFIAARESSCDEETVAALGCPPGEYAQTLLDIVRERRTWQSGWFAIGVSPLQMSERRLAHLMNPSIRFRRRTPIHAWLVGAALVGLLLPGAGLAVQRDAVAANSTAQPPAAGAAMHLSGSVIDAETSKPIAGATVIVHFESDSDGNRHVISPDAQCTTDAAGVFTFEVTTEQQAEKGLFLGIDVSHPHYASRTGEGCGFSLIEQAKARGQKMWFAGISLRPGEPVTGLLLDGDGKPAANVPIAFCSVYGLDEMRFMAMGDKRSDGQTTTDEHGRFRFNVLKGSQINCFWARPDDQAILYYNIRDLRGDLGTFRLERGIAIPGTVLTTDGKPVAGVGVTLESLDTNELANPVADRRTETDTQGKFVFKPVPPGAYEVNVTNVLWDEKTRMRREVALPGAFVKQMVIAQYLAYNRFPPIQIKAVDDVALVIHYRDSAGKPIAGNQTDFFGKITGDSFDYNVAGRSGADGITRLLVPRAVRDVKAILMGDALKSVRWRIGDAGPSPWQAGMHGTGEASLGQLDAATTDLYATCYHAPVLIVNAVNARGKEVPNFLPYVLYPGDQPATRTSPRAGDERGDVLFAELNKSGWRSYQLLPDVELTVAATAKGYTAVAQKMTLKEGEKREVTIQMDQSPP